MVGFSLYITLFCFFNIFLITHQLFDKKFQKKLFDVYLKEQDEADHYSPVVNSGHDPHYCNALLTWMGVLCRQRYSSTTYKHEYPYHCIYINEKGNYATFDVERGLRFPVTDGKRFQENILTPQGLRITGFNYGCPDHHLPYPDYNLYSFQLFYKRSRFYDDWVPYLDENGDIKTFEYGGFKEETEGPFGYFYFDISPGIISSHIRLFFNNMLYSKKECYVHVYGCYDDQTYGELQLYGKEKFLTSKIPTAQKDHKVKNLLFWKSYLDTRPALPSDLEGCPLFDFESGTMANWTLVGEAFNFQPTVDDTKFLREKVQPTGIEGSWWVSTREKHPFSTAPFEFQSYDLEGSATSPEFLINTTRISFLIGGRGGDVGAQLLAFTKVVAEYVVKKKPSNVYDHQDKLVRRYFDVEQHIGKKGQLRLFDNNKDGYLMFDDLRTVSKCSNFRFPLGMGSGNITDNQITGGNAYSTRHADYEKHRIILDDPKYSSQASRLILKDSTTENENIFKAMLNAISDVFIFPDPFLEINLKSVHLIDGWATQMLTAQETLRHQCDAGRYFVLYMQSENMWRTIAYREILASRGEVKHNDPTIAKTIIFNNPHPKSYPTIDRRYLNPRVRAKIIRFVVKNALYPQLPFVCFRVELYGANLEQRHSDEEVTKIKDDYSLITVTVNKRSLTRKNIQLKCLDEGHILTAMEIEISWMEIVFKSRVKLHGNKNVIGIPLTFGFTRKVIACEAMLGKKLLYTREYLLIDQLNVEAFVTQEASSETRGGRLIHNNPVVLYTDGFKPFFLSVHFANIVRASYIHVPAHDDRACFAITAHHTTGFEDKICDKKEMEAFQPCHARAEKAKHRWAFSARDYFFAGNLRSWTIDDRDRCTYCIHFLRQSPNCVRYWKYENCPVCYDKDNYHRFKGRFYRMSYTPLAYTITIKLFKQMDKRLPHRKRDEVPFYSRYFDLYKLVEQLNVKRSKLNSLNFNPIRFLQYHPCDREKFKAFNEKEPFPGQVRACASYFSQYAQKHPGFGRILTFVYTDRDYVWRFTNPEQIRLEVTYNPVRGLKDKSIKKHFIIRSGSKPVIVIPKIIGICSGQHRSIEARLEFPDPSFSDRSGFQLLWSRVVEAGVYSKEKVNPIKTEFIGEKLGKYLKQRDWSYHDGKKLHIFYANHLHSGLYQVTAQSKYFGDSVARFRIDVVEDYPKISWTPDSPFYAVAETNDVLEIKTGKDEKVKDITWFKDGNVITESSHFHFIDFVSKPQEKKRLLLKGISKGNINLSGNYHVRLDGDYCSFDAKVKVIVHRAPIITIKPKAKVSKEGVKELAFKKGSTMKIVANIVGGFPTVEVEMMTWYKGRDKLSSISKGRLQISNIKIQNGWMSTISIKEFNNQDVGAFKLLVENGKAFVESRFKVVVAKR